MASAAPSPSLLLLRARPRRLSLPHPTVAAAARPTLDGGGGPRRAPRRLFLGLGASLIDQFARMASGSGGRSFVASARPQRGVSPIEQILKNVEWPEKFPFKDEDFSRFDESPDSLFYSEPRFVTHIDDPAIRALTKYYSEVFPPSNSPGVCLLDLCSSWVSHYPAGYRQDRMVGMGMNEEELKRNPVLTEYVVQDININPKLPFEDNTFDVITNVVSVDYLTKPIDVFKEMQRILKPGGLAIMRLWTYLPTLDVQTQCMLYTPESKRLPNHHFFGKLTFKNLRKEGLSKPKGELRFCSLYFVWCYTALIVSDI